MFRTHYNREKKLWSGRNIAPLYNPNCSLAQAVLRACTSHHSRIAQISDNSGIKLTYDEMRIRIIRGAQNLQRLGYGSGQVFSVIAKNSHNVAPILFASLSIGSAVNTLDPSFGKTELEHMLKSIKPTLVFCDSDIYAIVKECLIELKNNARVFTFGGKVGDSTQVENLLIETNLEHQFVPVNVDGVNETAVIVCSSGTTGLSKGVCLSHAALLNAAVDLEMVGSCDVMLSFSSLYWLTGWLTLLSGMINGSTRIITTQPFNPELQLEFIEKYRVTFVLNSPHHLTTLLKCDRLHETDLSSVKYSLVGGAKCSFHVQTELSSLMPNGKVYAAYGLSEAAGLISMNSSDKDAIGQLANGFSVKIIDDDGNRCGVGEDGEICFKGNYKFLGYYGNQQATDEVLDADGFFLTADIGHFDDVGNLYIVDRKKDLIKYCGFQISPSQIEAQLIQSPDIKAVCVVGIPDDNNATELPAAIVVRCDKSNITEKRVSEMVADHFADYCKLRGGVFFVESIPTTPSGKLLRRKAKEMALKIQQ